MKKVRNILLFALFPLLAGPMLTSCGVAKVKDIRVTSVGLESYSLNGLRSVDAVLTIGIDNPTFAFTLTDLSGILKYNGEDFATYTADTLMVDKKCVKVYDLPCTATLNDKVNFMQVMKIARNGSLEGFTTDIQAKAKLRNGAGRTLVYKDLDLQEMIEE